LMSNDEMRVSPPLRIVVTTELMFVAEPFH
jgi:hypothetical protein